MPVEKIMTPEFRVSFPAIFKPRGFEGSEPKYSVNMLFPKSTDLSELKRIAKAAADEKWPNKEKRPKDLRNPFRDGDAEKPDWDGYQDVIFVKASSKMKPGLVDQNVQPIIEEGEFYAGCWARATITAFAYNKAGNAGVAFGLQNIQKVRDDEEFSGRGKAEDEFDAIESVDDDGAPAEVTKEPDNIFG